MKSSKQLHQELLLSCHTLQSLAFKATWHWELRFLSGVSLHLEVHKRNTSNFTVLSATRWQLNLQWNTSDIPTQNDPTVCRNCGSSLTTALSFIKYSVLYWSSILDHKKCSWMFLKEQHHLEIVVNAAKWSQEISYLSTSESNEYFQSMLPVSTSACIVTFCHSYIFASTINQKKCSPSHKPPIISCSWTVKAQVPRLSFVVFKA